MAIQRLPGIRKKRADTRLKQISSNSENESCKDELPRQDQKEDDPLRAQMNPEKRGEILV
jgi:hypothetical protein